MRTQTRHRPHPIGPVSLDVGPDGNLDREGYRIVSLIGYARDARAIAVLPPADPAWDDALCTPSDLDDSPHLIAPEALTLDPSVTLVGEIGAGWRFASAQDDAPELTDTEASTAVGKLLARLGLS